MKKTCNGCRALNNGCSLGFKTSILRRSQNGFPPEYKPEEDCPKPKTYKEFIFLLNTPQTPEE